MRLHELRIPQLRIGPVEGLLLLALAVALGLATTLSKPTLLIGLVAGCTLLVAAFLSTSLSLYFLIFSMLLSPELAFGRLEGRGVGGRGITIRLDDILLLIIGFTWLAKTIIYRELGLIKRTPLNWPIMLYMAACILATLLGVLTGRVQLATGFFYLLKYFEYFFIFFMVVNNVRTREQMVHLLVAVLVTGFLTSLYAISLIPSGQRATAPFEGGSGEPNTLGGYLVFMMAIATGLLLHVRGAAVRGGLVALLGLLGLALMATLSRTSYVAAGGLIVALVATQWRRPAVLATVLVGAILLPLIAPDNVKQRVSETFYGKKYGGEITVGGVTVDYSTTERLRSWAVVIRDWSRRPLFGYGVTGYAWADAQYVKILGETGIAGIVAFFFLIWSLWKRVRESLLAEQDPVCRGLALGFLLGLIAMLAHAVGANTFIIIRIMEPFWLCAGLVVALPTLQNKITATSRAQVPV